MTKPFSQASENNKKPILEKIVPLLPHVKSVIEIGSGTGQHAVHFGQAMPHLTWQTSDLIINHSGINQCLIEANLPNVIPPIEIDLNEPWPVKNVDAIYTANTLHIVPFNLVKALFKGISKHLNDGGLFIAYGPFKYDGEFTSDSNASFDVWLKDRVKHQGIRNIEDILVLAASAELNLLHDYKMPANNQMLIFIKNSDK